MIQDIKQLLRAGTKIIISYPKVEGKSNDLKQSDKGEWAILLCSVLSCRFKTAWSIVYMPLIHVQI